MTWQIFGLQIAVSALIIGQFATVMTIRNLMKVLKYHQDHLAIHDEILSP